ncbi:MAG: iron-regulated protein [Bacteroidetes bacterium]|nr:MAG: iron-regulated protein [Bacteroidota bacterium]
MIKSKLFIIIAIAFSLMAMKSDKRAFQLFSSKGKVVKYKAVLKAISKADIVFFGELHNNAISHWMEYELAKDLIAQKGDKIVLGAEMYEADGQLLIDEYLSGLVKYKYFKGQARLWPNDPTDYKPLLQLAHDNKIPFIATNVPRRYASAVNKGGFEILEKFSDEAKRYFAPLPIQYDENVACYKSMQEMMGAHGANIAKAQGLKDATMAYFIMKNWKKGQTFLHFNGSYHSDNHEGIVWHLKQKYPKLKIITITTIEQDQLDSIDMDVQKQADYILVVDQDVTKTY